MHLCQFAKQCDNLKMVLHVSTGKLIWILHLSQNNSNNSISPNSSTYQNMTYLIVSWDLFFCHAIFILISVLPPKILSNFLNFDSIGHHNVLFPQYKTLVLSPCLYKTLFFKIHNSIAQVFILVASWCTVSHLNLWLTSYKMCWLHLSMHAYDSNQSYSTTHLLHTTTTHFLATESTHLWLTHHVIPQI